MTQNRGPSNREFILHQGRLRAYRGLADDSLTNHVLRKLKMGHGWVGSFLMVSAPRASEMGNEYQQQKGAIPKLAPFWRRRQFRDDELIRQRANALEWNGRGGRGSKERGGGAPKNGAQKAANNSNNNGHARSLNRCSAVSSSVEMPTTRNHA